MTGGFPMKQKVSSFFKEMTKNRALYLMFLPAAIILILFNYLPMFGLVTAFKDFNFADGIFVVFYRGGKALNLNRLSHSK